MMPFRSRKHQNWIRTLPCVVAGCRRKPEAAHIGPHGMSQKAPDTHVLPICNHHHMELHGPGGRRGFESKYGLSLLGIVGLINARPLLRMEGTAWVGYYAGEVYVLTPKASGLVEAIRRMQSIRREFLEGQLGRAA